VIAIYDADINALEQARNAARNASAGKPEDGMEAIVRFFFVFLFHRFFFYLLIFLLQW
jgi:hypothetical protein